MAAWLRAVTAMLLTLIFSTPWTALGALVQHKFTVGTQNVTRLCKQQKIVTVNERFPGPTIYVHEGDTVNVQVVNKSPYNVTIHWHGVRQLKSCWADGPAYITQCPITPGNKYTYNFTVTKQEGTLFWHVHISWLRATVHGALVIYPRTGNPYPFREPAAEFPIILGEWWNVNVEDVIMEAIQTGGFPNISNALTINSHRGDLIYPCSMKDTFRALVLPGKTYLLRLINAALNEPLFFKIADHKMTVVAVDASYTKPYRTNVVLIYPGQTTDVLLKASKSSGRYYMAARAYHSAPLVPFNNSTTTAILQYKSFTNTTIPIMPCLPDFNHTPTAHKFSTQLKSLRPSVPQSIDEEMLITEGLGELSCPKSSCPLGGIIVGSFNNISFVSPHVDILQAYYYAIDGVFTRDFPDNPPLKFDYTGQNLSATLIHPEVGTKVKVLKFNSTVQVVFQSTSLVSIESHPIHIHGFDFYVVGQGFGNYNPKTDSAKFNLLDPQKRSTFAVPAGGWAAIRFTADNPGIWTVHCHFDRHSEFGFLMLFLVENGPGESDVLPPPPLDLPKC